MLYCCCLRCRNCNDIFFLSFSLDLIAFRFKNVNVSWANSFSIVEYFNFLIRHPKIPKKCMFKTYIIFYHYANQHEHMSKMGICCQDMHTYTTTDIERNVHNSLSVSVYWFFYFYVALCLHWFLSQSYTFAYISYNSNNNINQQVTTTASYINEITQNGFANKTRDLLRT